MNLHDDFSALRRLLVLKRYEQPPPGYFERLPGQVIARIRAEEQNRNVSILDRLTGDDSWLRRLWSSLESKPLFAGGFGVAVCGVLLAGVLISERSGSSLSAVPIATDLGQPQAILANTLRLPEPALGQFSGLPAAPQQGATESLFQRIKETRSDAVLISTPANGR